MYILCVNLLKRAPMKIGSVYWVILGKLRIFTLFTLFKKNSIFSQKSYLSSSFSFLQADFYNEH